MLQYRKSRQIEDFDIIIDGVRVELKTPNIRYVAYQVVEYIDTIKYIPNHLELDKKSRGEVSNIIVQAFSDLFRTTFELDVDPHKLVEEIIRVTNGIMIPRMKDVIDRYEVSAIKFEDACRTFIPDALIKLKATLTTDLSH